MHKSTVKTLRLNLIITTVTQSTEIYGRKINLKLKYSFKYSTTIIKSNLNWFRIRMFLAFSMFHLRILWSKYIHTYIRKCLINLTSTHACTHALTDEAILVLWGHKDKLYKNFPSFYTHSENQMCVCACLLLRNLISFFHAREKLKSTLCKTFSFKMIRCRLSHNIT